MIITIFSIFLFISFIALIRLKKLNKEILFLFIGICLFLFAGFRDGNRVRDYKVYTIIYEYDIGSILVQTELSFALIVWFVKSFFNNVLFLFIIYAFLGVYLKFKAIKELSLLCFFSILVYIGNFYIRHELTQIRAGVATGFFLLCIKPIYERDFKKFVIFSSVAIFFHISSLMILPLWFLNGNKINKYFYASIIPISYILYFIGITNIVQIMSFLPIKLIQLRYQVHVTESIENLNIFSIFFLGKCVIYYILLLNNKLLASHNRYAFLLLKINAIALMSYILLSSISGIARRTSEFYGIVEIINIPMLIYIFTPKILTKLIIIAFSLLLLFVSVFYIKLI
jgi:hypothetical protein